MMSNASGSAESNWPIVGVQLHRLATELAVIRVEIQQCAKHRHPDSDILRQFALVLQEIDRTKEAIALLIADGTPVLPDIANADLEVLTKLTPREIQVLKLIGEGKRSKEIAHLLGIAVKTVVSHRSNLGEKLEIHEAANLVRFALRSGLSSV